MAGIEDTLPLEYQFNTTLKELRCEVADELYEDIEDLDILTADHEFNMQSLRLMDFSETLSLQLASELEDVDTLTPVIYRSLTVGLQIAERLSLGKFKGLSGGYFENIEASERGARIQADTQEYLASRPEVDYLIGEFWTDVDPSYLYGHHVETVMAFVLMLTEKEDAEQYLAAQTEQLDPSQFFLEGR